MNGKTKQIVTAALFAALACVATMVIKIPSPMDGYLNLGDCVVLAAGWLLAPGYGFLAAGLGSGLADLFSGYAAYAPATFAIKGLMALIAFYGFKALSAKTGSLTARILSGAAAELFGLGPLAAVLKSAQTVVKTLIGVLAACSLFMIIATTIVTKATAG